MSKVASISGQQEPLDSETLAAGTLARLRSAADKLPHGKSFLGLGQTDHCKACASRSSKLTQLESGLARQSLAEVPIDPQLAARRVCPA